MEPYQKQFNNEVYQKEFSWIKQRRKSTQHDDSENENTTGIALSGGGIRSATFNLGVLQALEKHQSLSKFDYMSSVSGGGYTASALTWFASKLPNTFPFGTKRADHNSLGGSILSWIRAHSNFLTPGNGTNKISLLTALFTGTLINLLIIMPVFVLVFFLLNINLADHQQFLSFDMPITGFHLLKVSGYVFIGLSVLFMLITALSTGKSSENESPDKSARRSKRTEKLRRYVASLFTFGLVSISLGLIPSLHQLFEHFAQWLIHASFSLSFIGVALSWLGARKSKNEAPSSSITLLISIGLLLTCLGVFIVCYHIIKPWLFLPGYFYLVLGLSVVLAARCNINLVSMHGYYRNRLRDAFMPFQIPADDHCSTVDIATWQEAQQCYLAELKPSNAPLHLINCNIELSGSAQSKYRNRAADSFTLSALFCGATSTGYCQTSDYMNGSVDLATACAISGAAVATNTPKTRSKPLNFIMALLNLRLGCWLENPKTSCKDKSKTSKHWWYVYMFRDMFGRGLNENKPYIHLSDGGHFENLGIYELVRRKCRIIYAFDAGADPDYKFSDLARLTELIRVDFGAKLQIDISEIMPKTNSLSATAWAEGEIHYADGSIATLIYVKASLLEDLSEDIYGYKRENSTFPNQSTADQFYDEVQFEAYRELGFQLTHRMLKTEGDIDAMLTKMASANDHKQTNKKTIT